MGDGINVAIIITDPGAGVGVAQRVGVRVVIVIVGHRGGQTVSNFV